MGNRKTRTHHKSLCETGRLDLRTSTRCVLARGRVQALAMVGQEPRGGEKSFEDDEN